MEIFSELIYTCAELCANEIHHQYLIPKYIFKVNKKTGQKYEWKLFPMELLEGTLYEELKTKVTQKYNYYYSPEMLIFARDGIPTFEDKELLEKSIVFSLAIILTELCTKKASKGFYNSQATEILDQKIQ